MNKIIILLISIILLSVQLSPGQGNPSVTRMQNQIYTSFIRGDIPLWERSIRELERIHTATPTDEILYDLLLARYGYIAFSMEKNPSAAKKQLDMAEKELEKLLRNPSWLSHAKAMQGAFLGFRISLRPISAVLLGPRSYRAINEAVEADKSNPVAWMEMANSRFYTPSAFGGSKQEARDYYSQSVQLFEKNLKPNQRWLYLNSLVGLAKSYEFLDRKDLAIATYKKALTFEPEFKWVRDELLPGILRKN
jgi:tetratricopeptide (TPR) repeat protein